MIIAAFICHLLNWTHTHLYSVFIRLLNISQNYAFI